MPDRPEIALKPFDHPVAVEAADIDANGHVNNVVYLRWVQDAAVAHWFAAVDPETSGGGPAWAVVRHEIDYKRPAMPGDALVVRTWIGEVSAITVERFCNILRPSDGRMLAKVRTLWCSFDLESGRPRRIDPKIQALFAPA